jgi:hypothetical protein
MTIRPFLFVSTTIKIWHYEIEKATQSFDNAKQIIWECQHATFRVQFFKT